MNPLDPEDQKFDSFLRKSAGPIPPAPLGEKSRLRRKLIEGSESSARLWWELRSKKHVLVPAVSLVMAFVITIQVRHHQRQAAVDRVIAAAIGYYLDDQEVR